MSDSTWARRWMKRAMDDFEAAQYLYENFHPKKLEIICYQCQQAAEKALKAYLVMQEYDFPYTHDCRKLCVLCSNFNEAFNDYISDCTDLTPYATQARYPDNDEITEEETKSALLKAERVVNFCASLIAPE